MFSDKPLVAGIELDIQGMANDFRAVNAYSQAGNLNQNIASSESVDFLGTVRGRLGFLMTPTLLVYGTGGFAYGQVNATTGITQFVTNVADLPSAYSTSARFSNLWSGWTAGGGGEWLFLPNWSVKVEYLYYHLPSASFGLSPLQNFNAEGVLTTSVAPISRPSFNGNIAASA